MSSMWERTYSRGSITSKALSLLPSYRVFRKTYKFLKKSQWWSKEQLEEYQLQQLSKLLNHAYANVPYYRRVFDERGLKPEDIKDINDLQKLPLLTKEIVRKNLDDLKARNYSDDKFEAVRSSGSTGKPAVFYYEKGISHAIEWAFMKTQWDRVGYHFRDKCVILRGHVVDSARQEKFWETALFRRWLIMSSFHLRDDTLPKYIEKIRKFKPKFIQAYPSTITIIAKFMKKNNIDSFPTVNAILCGSENLYPWQRELLEEVFQCRIYSWYGMSEHVVLAGGCEFDSHYHLFPEYGIVELIDVGGNPVTKENPGEIVGTCLHNYIFPLIRYRTNDIATLTPKKCKCGREYQLVEYVEGRLLEYIVTKNWQLVPVTAIHYESEAFDNVSRFQFYQDKPGEVILSIVQDEDYTEKDTKSILDQLKIELEDNDVTVTIRFVDNIPPMESGKFKYIIQKLPIDFKKHYPELNRHTSGELKQKSSIQAGTYSHSSITRKALSLLPSYRVFRKTYKFLKKSQWWSKEQLERYQLEQLSKLLNHAYENVPYYRKVFDGLGLKPGDIKDFKDLQKLPFLTKEIIRENLGDLKARNYPEAKFEYVTTGGTTGTLGVYYEKGVSRAREWAFMKTQWDRVGYHFRDKCVILRGYAIKSEDKSKFSKPSFFGRWLILSTFHMSDENLPKYIEKIRKFKPKFIQTYPSTIIILAEFMKEHRIGSFPSVKALLCGSENLYPWQRELLEDIFQCRVYSWYGHAEQTVLAGECEVSSNYHVFPEYGIVELIDTNDKPITKENESGEVVATGLSNYLMPLVRYRTMDLAKLSNKKCECGRNYNLIKEVEGRLQDLIVTKDKRLIPLTSLLASIKRFEGFPKVRRAQFIQEKEGEIRIKIIRGAQYTNEDDAEILTAIYELIGDELDVKIEHVEHIPRTKRGKYRYLIQKLPIKLGDLNG